MTGQTKMQFTTTTRNFYQVLGISADATPAEIRAAFVRLSKMHHPDLARDGWNLPWRFQEVQQAYRCLSDRDMRAAHDRSIGEIERHHFTQQRAVQQRLRRFDKRHPQAIPRRYPDKCWRILVTLAIIAGIIAHLSLRMIG